jgi:hypothetical protein
LAAYEGQACAPLLRPGNDALTSVAGLASLTRVGGALSVRGNDALTSLAGLEQLAQVDGPLRLVGTRLVDLGGLSSLRSVGGVALHGNDALASLTGLGQLRTLVGSLVVGGRDGAEPSESYCHLDHTVDADACACAQPLSLGNGALTSLAPLANLTRVGGDVVVRGNPRLARLGLSRLQAVGGDLTLGGVELIRECSPVRGECVARPEVYGNALERLDDLPRLRELHSLRVQGEPSLTSLYLPSLVEAHGDLILGGASLFVWQPREARVAELVSLGNPRLASVALPALARVGGDLRVEREPALTTLGDYPALQSIGGDLRVASNERLNSLGDLRALQSIGGDLLLGPMPYRWHEQERTMMWSNGNPALWDLSALAALRHVSGALVVVDNAALPMQPVLDLMDRVWIEGCTATCPAWDTACRCR